VFGDKTRRTQWKSFSKPPRGLTNRSKTLLAVGILYQRVEDQKTVVEAVFAIVFFIGYVFTDEFIF
jgi:hypothetical protein